MTTDFSDDDMFFKDDETPKTLPTVATGPDPTRARAQRTRNKHDRWATEMREHGWWVTAPEDR